MFFIFRMSGVKSPENPNWKYPYEEVCIESGIQLAITEDKKLSTWRRYVGEYKAVFSGKSHN